MCCKHWHKQTRVPYKVNIYVSIYGICLCVYIVLAIKQKMRRQHLVKSLANFISFLRFPAAQNVRGQKGLWNQMAGGREGRWRGLSGIGRVGNSSSLEVAAGYNVALNSAEVVAFSVIVWLLLQFSQLATGNCQLATTAITYKLFLLLLLLLPPLFAISLWPVWLAQVLTEVFAEFYSEF